MFMCNVATFPDVHIVCMQASLGVQYSKCNCQLTPKSWRLENLNDGEVETVNVCCGEQLSIYITMQCKGKRPRSCMCVCLCEKVALEVRNGSADNFHRRKLLCGKHFCYL